MSEELQGAVPQAGKTEVADLKEEFEGASIPTEATKPEATEERKEVAVKSEDIPSPLQTQQYENLSDDVSQTKEVHPSSSASESSLNVDPMSNEEPSEKMAASSRFPDSVQVDKKPPFEVTPSQTKKTEGHTRTAAKSEVKLPMLHEKQQMFKDIVSDKPLSIIDIQSPLDSFNPANSVECPPENVESPSPHLSSSMSHTHEKCTKISEELQGAAPQAGKTEVSVLKEGFKGASIPTEETKPEAPEKSKEVTVSDDVSQTKEVHPSSSAHESSLNIDPMSNEEPSEKMAASPRFPDSVQDPIVDSQDTDLQKGLMLSFEDNHLNKTSEASLKVSKSSRVGQTPVGLKNIGNTCWFNAVIQSLFHIPKFRDEILVYSPPPKPEANKAYKPEANYDSRCVAIATELKKLFRLLVVSNKKCINPSQTIQSVREIFNTGAQEDVCEFICKLLDYLGNAFKLSLDNGSSDCRFNPNPIFRLFHGHCRTERISNRFFVREDVFTTYLIPVEGHTHLHDSLDSVTFDMDKQQQTFFLFPPILILQLSRFYYNQNTRQTIKSNNKLDFDLQLCVDRYLEKNKEESYHRKKEADQLRKRVNDLKSKLNCYTQYNSSTDIRDINELYAAIANSKTLEAIYNDPLMKRTPYFLHSVLVHQGEASGGHYWAYTRKHPLLSLSSPRTPLSKPGYSSTPDLRSLNQTETLQQSHAEPSHQDGTGIVGRRKSCGDIKASTLLTVNNSKASSDVRSMMYHRQSETGEVGIDIAHSMESHETVSVAEKGEKMELEKFYSASSLSVEPPSSPPSSCPSTASECSWIKFNDKSVSEVKWEEVRRESQGGTTSTTSAYSLVYFSSELHHDWLQGEKCTKMSEELQGAAPQADLKEGFEGASIPTEATKPEALEKHKEVAVSDDVSPRHSSSSASESSLNVDPMSNEEPSEKMAASRFPDSVQETYLEMCEKENAAIPVGGIAARPLQPIWKQDSSVISQPSQDRRHLTNASSDLTKLSEIFETLPEDNKTKEVRKIRIEVLNHSMKKMYRGPNDDLRVFYCIATPLYRMKQSTLLCPLCLIDKEKRITEDSKKEAQVYEKDSKKEERINEEDSKKEERFNEKDSKKEERINEEDSKKEERFNEKDSKKEERINEEDSKKEERFNEKDSKKEERINEEDSKKEERFNEKDSKKEERINEKDSKKEERIKNKGTNAHPKSHIFPSCILKLYKKIHCKPVDKEFIYDQISCTYKGGNALSFPIFCRACELNASKEEGALKDMYLKLTGTTDEEHLSNDYYMVKHILAVILFRGMLLGVNFLKEIEANQDFFYIFDLLREYCFSADYESCWVSKFHVFILGNKHYNPNNKDPRYKHPLELQLRNPQFTTMVKTNEGQDVFLYMKFDCFHCVLPIKSTTIRFPEKEAFHKFPLFLWKYNLQEVGILVPQLISTERTITAYIKDPLDQSLPELPPSIEVLPSIEVIPAVSDRLKKAENAVLLTSAQNQSPLAPLAMVNSRDPEKSDLEKKHKDLVPDKRKQEKSELNKLKQSHAKLIIENEKNDGIRKRKMEKLRQQHEDMFLSERGLEKKNCELEEEKCEWEEEKRALENKIRELQQENEQLILHHHPLTMDKEELVDDDSGPQELVL